MIYLEYIRLVQFYLFESQEIRLGEISAILGPNATGKSSLIDAVQIAMLGANQRLIALNAQADENTSSSRQKRSIRSYCLGKIGEHDTDRIRDVATTYITLVWRDSETSEPISMGVCIYAAADRETHEVSGLYLLRGVNLKLGDHLEIVEGKERPRDWPTFRVHLLQAAKKTGENPIYSDAGKFIQAILLALRGSGAAAAPNSFTRAFRFALRMKFDRTIDEIVRNDVLEARPTKIKKFKEITESFRLLSEKVAYVEAEITDGKKVAADYQKVDDESRKSMTFSVLAKLAEAEVLTESFNTAIQEREEAEKTVKRLTDELAELSGEKGLAAEQSSRFKLQREAHSAHKDYGALQTAIDAAREKSKRKWVEIHNGLLQMARLLTNAALFEGLKQRVSELKQAANAAASLANDDVNSCTWDRLKEVLSLVLDTASKTISELEAQEKEKDLQIEEARNRFKNLSDGRERLKQGHAPLDNNVQQLLRELRDNGLHPTPVCDLVRIKDPSWQPVIESFLSSNVQALLLPSVEEADAFGIYRGLSGSRAIYGAKIARESRQQVGKVPEKGTVAELIEGDHPAAVAYLRRQFGNIRCATAASDALGGPRTLTKDGMLTGDDIERLSLTPAHRLHIGAGGREHRAAVELEYKSAEKALQELISAKAKIASEKLSLDEFANPDLIIKFTKNTWNEMQTAVNESADKSKLMEEAADAEYVELGRQEEYWKLKVAELGEKERMLSEELGTARAQKEQCDQKEKEVYEQRKVAISAAEKAKADPQYDHVYGMQEWERCLNKVGEKYHAMVDQFNELGANAQSNFTKKATNAGRALGEFLLKYKEHAPAETSDDWRIAREWIRELLKRLEDTELVQYKGEMDNAYRKSRETFSNDVAVVLSNNLDWLDDTLDGLNAVLRECPPFQNGEKYQFRRAIRPKYADLLRFVKNVAAQGPEEDLFGGPGQIPDEFRLLLEEKTAPGAAGIPNPLDDYREFFEFDVEILREDSSSKAMKVVGHLSSRIGIGSGAEHRAPLYVIAGAALASAYRLDKGQMDGLRLMLLDEAFNRMDPTNIIATMRYLEDLNLQVVMASPGENEAYLTAFLHRYYNILRDVDNNTVLLEGYDVSADTRALFREDLPEFNPELVKNQLAAMRGVTATASTQGIMEP